MSPVYSWTPSQAVPRACRRPKKNDKNPTYESALAELDGIVSRMEGGQLTLEQSLTD